MYPVQNLYDKPYSYVGFNGPLIPLSDYLQKIKDDESLENSTMVNKQNVIIGVDSVQAEPIIIGARGHDFSDNWSYLIDRNHQLKIQDHTVTKPGFARIQNAHKFSIIKENTLEQRKDNMMANSEKVYKPNIIRGCDCIIKKPSIYKTTPYLRYDKKAGGLVISTDHK